MSASKVEAFLAKIYTDEHERERFLADPQAEARRAGLTEEETNALEKIDRTGLEMIAESLKRKRGKRGNG